jgi:hypothetical protein
VFKLVDIARGIGELDLFDNIGFVWVFELDDIAGGILRNLTSLTT